MRFSKSVRNVVSTTAVLYAIFYMTITLYLPSLAFAEGEFPTLQSVFRGHFTIVYFHFKYFVAVSGHNIHVVSTIVCCCCVVYTMMVSDNFFALDFNSSIALWNSITFFSENHVDTGRNQSRSVDGRRSMRFDCDFYVADCFLWNSKSRRCDGGLDSRR